MVGWSGLIYTRCQHSCAKIAPPPLHPRSAVACGHLPECNQTYKREHAALKNVLCARVLVEITQLARVTSAVLTFKVEGSITTPLGPVALPAWHKKVDVKCSASISDQVEVHDEVGSKVRVVVSCD